MQDVDCEAIAEDWKGDYEALRKAHQCGPGVFGVHHFNQKEYRSIYQVGKIHASFQIKSCNKNIFSCCEEWKECYTDITQALKSNNSAQLPDGAGIFTQIDAFMQRCRDLQDIADCQAQFAR